MTPDIWVAIITALAALVGGVLTYIVARKRGDRKRIGSLETRQDKLEGLVVGWSTWAMQQNAHIWAGKPPPPPDMPQILKDLLAPSGVHRDRDEKE